MSAVTVHRSGVRLLPDPARVIAKPYLPAEDSPFDETRASLLVSRALAIPEPRALELMASVRSEFTHRHPSFERLLLRHFEIVAHHVRPGTNLTRERKLLIGAYFTHEYSLEAAALFNPSIVPAPDQNGLAEGSLRFVLSLRAVGEGHISSIQFRAGVVDAAGLITLDPPTPLLVTGTRSALRYYDKALFTNKLAELDVHNDMSRAVMDRLPEKFTLAGLETSLAKLEEEGPPASVRFETAKIMRVLAASSYMTSFPPDSPLAARVIFPAGPHETRGMEDARFVRIVEPDGSARYYATYTAYDGFNILPQLIETDDFESFTISTLNGLAAQNKGMALFPRRIRGKYAVLSRRDRENLHIATSDNIRFWDDVTELRRPTYPWELLNIGNCGSPIETEAGWLVLTHGVGPMRKYTISAILLSLEDPSVIIGELEEPFLSADASERDGYVPNVVYSCGGLLHGNHLIVPYGFSDYGTAIATVEIAELLSALRRH
jgi:predicted GH43/DUF377 family glycosyl hydrolase